MARDYHEIIRALRAKADDKATTPEEKKTLRDKANELEAKYGNSSSPIGDDTTVTSRDGFIYDPYYFFRPPTPPRPTHTDAFWATYMDNLLRKQWMWNTEYYDEDGNPVVREDVDNIYDETYKYAPEEDDDQ